MSALRIAAMVLALIGAGTALIVGIMTSVSVAGRAWFLAPIPGDVELTQLGIGLAISLCLPWCQYHSGNILIDFFTDKCTERTQRTLDAIGSVLIAAMYVLLSWRTTVGALSVKEVFEASMILDLPMWWIYAALAPGLAFAAVIALAQASRQFRGLAAVPSLDPNTEIVND